MKNSTLYIVHRAPYLWILGGVLVVLKALELISLSWLWVLAPFWFFPALGLAFLAICAVFGIICLVGIGVFFGVCWLLDVIGVPHRNGNTKKRFLKR